MILVSPDVLNTPPPEHPSPEQMKKGLFRADKFVPAANGYKALQMPDGRYVTWTNEHGGEFHFDATSIGGWEFCKVTGQMVTWVGAGPLAIRSWAEA